MKPLTGLSLILLSNQQKISIENGYTKSCDSLKKKLISLKQKTLTSQSLKVNVFAFTQT